MQKQLSVFAPGIAAMAALAALALSGPFTLRRVLPTDTVIAPHTLAKLKSGPFDLHNINPADNPRNDKNDSRNKK